MHDSQRIRAYFGKSFIVKLEQCGSHQTAICARTIIIALNHNGSYPYILPYLDGRKPDPYQCPNQCSSDKGVAHPYPVVR